MIQLFLVDDHPMIIDGLKSFINKYEEIKVIGEANSIDKLMEMLKNKQPDILILDIKLNNINSLEYIDTIKNSYPNLKIILFSSFNYPSIIKNALKKNIQGYLLKDSTPEEILSAIQKVYQGKKYIGENVQNIQNTDDSQTFMEHDGFLKKFKISVREKEVIKLIFQGKKSKEIADSLFISLNTVKTHRKNVLKKLDLHNSSELIKFVIENKLFN